MAIQQLLLGVGASEKTYVDDVFSTFLYRGTGNQIVINNGVDLSEGGLVWMKNRDTSYGHFLFDTERGTTKNLSTNSTSTEGTETAGVNAFNSNGFSIGTNGTNDGAFNHTSYDYSSWTFRKAPGFFDIVTWTGNETTNRVIPHNLGCVPGSIWIKCTTHTEPWTVYHREVTSGKTLRLDTTAAETTTEFMGSSINITSTGFTVGHNNEVNGDSGKDYIAYVFAGGESTAATARSIKVTGGGANNTTGNGYLTLASSSDFEYGTGDFTIEAWLRPDNSNSDQVFLNHGSDNPMIGVLNGKWQYYNSTVNSKYAGTPAVGQWTHYAVSRASGTTRLFINGELTNSFSDTHNYGAQVTSIGAYHSGTYGWNGGISNVRIVKGTAVYISPFRAPTEPLTNITNTKLLCCNNSSTTGSTVTPGTITANGSITASSDSPFDDPDGFVFGGDQTIIKCGSYHGNNNSNGPEVYLGWEPQWVLVKTLASGNWRLLDSMRGIVTGGADRELEPNSTSGEDTANNRIAATPTGFKIDTASSSHNDNNEYIYVAIRRSDGYVGKPPELGTDVFTTVASSSGKPGFISGFPVDFYLYRKPTTSSGWEADWNVYARLMAKKRLETNSSNAEDDDSYATFDFSNGVQDYADFDTSFQAWMWKRHAGMDVVAYKGDGFAGRQIPHSLSKTPEMMWVKNRSTSYRSWAVYHKDLGGSDPAYAFWLQLQDDSAQQPASYASGDTGQFYRAPTATHFSVNAPHNKVNATDENYIAMLFASVDKISKIGSYTGNGSTSGPTITTGFSPRFLFIKRIDGSGSWFTHDTVRGLSSGSSTSPYLRLDLNNAETSFTFGTTSSTGFTLATSGSSYNANGGEYIYYAHA